MKCAVIFGNKVRKRIAFVREQHVLLVPPDPAVAHTEFLPDLLVAHAFEKMFKNKRSPRGQFQEMRTKIEIPQNCIEDFKAIAHSKSLSYVVQMIMHNPKSH